MGDSKTWGGATLGEWESGLVSALETETGEEWLAYNAGVNSSALVSCCVWSNTYNAETETIHFPTTAGGFTVLVNFGVNDVAVGLPSESLWKARYRSLIATAHSKWPGAQIYLAKPWNRGSDASCNTLALWIDDLVAEQAYLHVGHDERVWLKGADNGATMTTDGVHYSVAGRTEVVNQWMTVLGY